MRNRERCQMSDVRCQLVFMPNHLTCERDATKRDTIKTGAHQFTQHTTHVVSRQSSVRFCTLSLVFRSLNRIIAIEIAKILTLGFSQII